MEINVYDEDEHRILYELTNKKKSYIAKITITMVLSEGEDECSKNETHEVHFPNIQEINVYETISHEPAVVNVYYLLRKTTKTYRFIRIEGISVLLDFKDWVDKNKHYGPYSIIIMEKPKDFITLKEAIIDVSIDIETIRSYFCLILKEVHELNKKYNFVHGDLLSRNVLVYNSKLRPKSGKIKLFDFDISTIKNKVSIFQINYENFEYIYPLTGIKGFLFDVARLYTGISYYIKDTCIFSKKYKVFNDLRHIVHEHDKKYEEGTNNVEYFQKWIEKDMNEIYQNVLLAINN